MSMIERSGVSPASSTASDASLRIGEILVRDGALTPDQASRAAQYGADHQIQFGEAAIELGFLAVKDVDAILADQVAAPPIAEPMRIADDLFSYHQPQSDAAEDIRTLRNALTLRWFQHPEGERTLSVISPARGDGRSAVTANLAVAFAQVGVRTLLIDADMRNPRQHELFGLENRFGLSGYLNGRGEEAAHFYIPGLERLTVIPVGALPPSPQELLLRPTLAALVETVSLNFDVILIDTPAASAGSDYQILARATRGAVMVSHKRSTRTRDAARMLTVCDSIGVTVVGGTMLQSRDT